VVARRVAATALALLLGFPAGVRAQETGAAALANALVFLRGDVPRVLYIAAHPDDEDTRLITWLQRGGYAEVAYLSLSRGEGGQNLIGNELGDALGVLRTQELLAARRIDGAAQFFTRGYDFGYSKTADEAFGHWPRDSLLADMVRIVRAWRPHVLASTFSGTPRDAHGQHQVSGILTRDVFDAAADTVRFPRTNYGAPWRPLKLYRLATFSGGATIGLNVGEYDPLAGRSFVEVASESRSQHRSQGYRRITRYGIVWDSLRREVTLVNQAVPAERERSILDGIQGGDRGAWIPRGSTRAQMATIDYTRPETAIPVIARYVPRDESERRRYDRAGALAAGLVFEALPARPFVAIGDTVTVTYVLHNRGGVSVRIDSAAHGFPRESIASGQSATWQSVLTGQRDGEQWWLAAGRSRDLYAVPASTVPEADHELPRLAHASVAVSGLQRPVRITARRVHRMSEPPYGDVLTPLVVAPGLTVTPSRGLWYARSGGSFDRELTVSVRSNFPDTRQIEVHIQTPEGLDAEPRSLRMEIQGGGRGTFVFRLSGSLRPGDHRIRVEAVTGDGQRFASAVQTIDYEHIISQRLYRPAEVRVTAVDAAIPAELSVGYIPGTADEGPHVLEELGVPVTRLAVGDLARTDLSRFTTIVVGPRAYEANAELISHNQRLFEFARAGGRLVVQFGQYPMATPGILPFRITISRPPTRVTDETAAVTFTDPRAPELTYPNRITEADFAGWVQERATFMPREFDAAYRTMLAMNDPGEDPVHGAVIVAPMDRGSYVYVTLALFRQFTEGVPGAARIFLNLLTPPGR
jgi:LmbE family N-acetylglucosaminyl deacetylase